MLILAECVLVPGIAVLFSFHVRWAFNGTYARWAREQAEKEGR